MPRRPKWEYSGSLNLGERHGGKLLIFKRRHKILRGPFKGRVGLESRGFTMKDIIGIRRKR